MKKKPSKVHVINPPKAQAIAAQVRDLNVINREFSEAATAIGDLQFKIHTYHQDCERILAKMSDLNKEAGALMAAQEQLRTPVGPPASGAV